MRATLSPGPRAELLALALLLGALYNPIFNYEALFLHGFQGGAVRAALSTAVFVVTFGVLVLRDRTIMWPLSTRSTLLVGAVLSFGTVRGLLGGNATRDVLADLFPLLELFAYAALAAWLLRGRNSSFVIPGAVVWGGAVALVEVILWARVGDHFATRVPIAGCTLPRLDDFMPILLLPPALAAAVAWRERRWLLVLASLTIGVAIAISFFRTTWLAAAVGVAVLLVLLLRRVRLAARIVALIAGIGVATAILLSLSPYVLGYTIPCSNPVVATPSPATSSTPTPSVVSTTVATNAPTTEPTVLPGGGATTIPTTRPTTRPTTVPTTVATAAASTAAATATPPPLSVLLPQRLDPKAIGEEPASFGGRITANIDMLRGVRDQPLLGVGLGGSFFNTSSGQYLPLSSAPNYFLAVLLELGIPATLVLAFVMLPELTRTITAAFRLPDEADRTAAIGVLAGVAGIAVSLAIFPAPLHFALGPYGALLARAIRERHHESS